MKIVKIVSCNSSVNLESIPWTMIEKLDPLCVRNDHDIWTLSHIKFITEIPDGSPIPDTWKKFDPMCNTPIRQSYFVNYLGPITCFEEKEF